MHSRRKKDRAIIFAPYDSLKGFFELIKEKEKIVVPKKELIEDELEILDQKIHQVKIGQIITIVYYDQDEYIKIEGMVAKIDLEYTKTIQIVKKIIHIDSIVQIDL